ncbi:MAG TPA: hypothetical protein DIT97_11495 [Gimesia maris]|uniref:Uncharacterized protein n=1 Tax=Gimesia maris TaxID=122 RepID=A0A3D3R4G0_9PLAN|nr:hypothetical protein [Gimesia maris]
MCKDIASAYCQKRKGVEVRYIYCRDEQEWHEMVLEDRRANPADLAAFRFDFRECLRSLPRRDRQFVSYLAKQHATSWVAKNSVYRPPESRNFGGNFLKPGIGSTARPPTKATPRCFRPPDAYDPRKKTRDSFVGYWWGEFPGNRKLLSTITIPSYTSSSGLCRQISCRTGAFFVLCLQQKPEK